MSDQRIEKLFLKMKNQRPKKYTVRYESVFYNWNEMTDRLMKRSRNIKTIWIDGCLCENLDDFKAVKNRVDRYDDIELWIEKWSNVQ